jgi:hypothetical protein
MPMYGAGLLGTGKRSAAGNLLLGYPLQGISPDAPMLDVRIAWCSQPRDSEQIYTSVTARLMSLHISRGRQHELQQYEAGEITIDLENDDRALEPEYSGSIYYPNIKRTRRVQVAMAWKNTTQYLYTGFIDRLPSDWGDRGNTNVARLHGLDLFSLLARNDDVTGILPAERSDQRIARVLDVYGWPAAERLLGTGRSVLAAEDFSGSRVNALQHMQDVVATEWGRGFIDGRGYVVFQARDLPFAQGAKPVHATFGTPASDSNVLPCTYIEAEYDDATLFNVVSVRAHDGTTFVVRNASSEADHGPRDTAIESLVRDHLEAFDQASALASIYADPPMRLPRIEIAPNMDARLWDHALAREIGDVIALYWEPIGGGAAIERTVVIEHIEHSWSTSEDWKTTFQVVPVIEGPSWWILGDATYSILGSTTTLGW